LLLPYAASEYVELCSAQPETTICLRRLEIILLLDFLTAH
jgi:hypothetical protein